MVQVCVMSMAGLITALLLKKDKPEFSMLIILLVSFFIAMKVLTILGSIIEEISGWSSLLQNNIVYVNLFLKMLGITYICEFASNLCKDAGYSALSNHIELFGKIMIMIAGLPVMKSMIEMLEGIIK